MIKGVFVVSAMWSCNVFIKSLDRCDVADKSIQWFLFYAYVNDYDLADTFQRVRSY